MLKTHVKWKYVKIAIAFVIYVPVVAAFVLVMSPFILLTQAGDIFNTATMTPEERKRYYER